MRRPVLTAILAITFMSTGVAHAAPTPSLNAHGSVEQVYVTDLTPGEQISLLDGKGATVATRQANDLGGGLFRNVAPGRRYRVQAADGPPSLPLAGLSTQSAPPSPDAH